MEKWKSMSKERRGKKGVRRKRREMNGMGEKGKEEKEKEGEEQGDLVIPLPPEEGCHDILTPDS
jgi:hypothetical protein